jgi:ADP-ribose pyrophosphatase YjhB (NUDIX family)
MNPYSQYSKQLIAVDCIIFGFDNNELNLLVIKRDFEPCKGKLSLIGGFLGATESLDECAYRILNKLTGLSNVYMQQLNTYGDPHRDEADRVVSVSYYALIKLQNLDNEHIKKHGARWIKTTSIPALLFDHNQMVHDALEALRVSSKTNPVGFELLPNHFTLPQIQSLYEAIYHTHLDKRNFRKKILSFQLLKKLNSKDKSGSKKGAFLYEFDKKKYEKLSENRFYLDVS